jgi:hypothetical protein
MTPDPSSDSLRTSDARNREDVRGYAWKFKGDQVSGQVQVLKKEVKEKSKWICLLLSAPGNETPLRTW